MKKIFTLCLAFLALGQTTQAQDTEELEPSEAYRFVNTTTGEPVADGATVEVTELNEQGQMVVPLALDVVADYETAGVVKCDITEMPNGEFSSCAFGQCLTPWSVAGVYDSYKAIVNDDYFNFYGNPSGIQTEWIPEAYATWTAKLQLYELEIVQKTVFGRMVDEPGDPIGYGPTVYVKFVYRDPAAINSTAAAEPHEVARFDAAGRQLRQAQKGINVVRMSDGTVRKVVVR